MWRIHKYRLIDSFQNNSYSFLYKFVSEWRNSQWSHFSIWLFNVYSSKRLRLIAFIFETLNNSLNFSFRKSICRIIIYAFSWCTIIGIQILICYKINVRTKKVSIDSCKHFVLVFLRIFLDSFQNFHCWFHSRFSSLINFNIWYTITASLRHVDGFPVSVFTAFPVNSGSSDYYGSSVTIWDIQCHLSCLTAWDLSPKGITHSPNGRHSHVGNPQFAWIIGCRLSVALSFRYYWFSNVSYELE